jgi:GNAT superfamily N-acetyltransferase
MMLIRAASSGDIPRIVELWKEMWEANRDPRLELSPLAEPVMTSWMEEIIRSDRSRVLVAQEGRDVTGYALGMIRENPPIVLHQLYGYISELSVTRDRRRTGTGRLLLDGMHAWFRSKGMPYVEVDVVVLNEGSRQFWRRNGYSEFLERLRVEL